MSELEWQLQAAFKHLRTSCFGFETMDVAAPRRSPLPEADMSLMRADLYAAMASPQLLRAHLQFEVFGIHTQKASSAHNEALFRLGSLLHCCVGRRLERLTLEAVDIKSDELRPFFSRLSPKMGLFELHGVRLLNGLWVPLLHAARQSIARRHLEEPCRASFSALIGSEFDKMCGDFTEKAHGWLNGSVSPPVFPSSSAKCISYVGRILEVISDLRSVKCSISARCLSRGSSHHCRSNLSRRISRAQETISRAIALVTFTPGGDNRNFPLPFCPCLE